jgi:hypothetical protein
MAQRLSGRTPGGQGPHKQFQATGYSSTHSSHLRGMRAPCQPLQQMPRLMVLTQRGRAEVASTSPTCGPDRLSATALWLLWCPVVSWSHVSNWFQLIVIWSTSVLPSRQSDRWLGRTKVFIDSNACVRDGAPVSDWVVQESPSSLADLITCRMASTTRSGRSI